jgi:hypothetical protein
MSQPPSARPWRIEIKRSHDASTVFFLRILDATGSRVADLYPHESVGGRGLEQQTADAQMIVALANSPAAAAFEAEARHDAPVEIPEAERAPGGGMARLL